MQAHTVSEHDILNNVFINMGGVDRTENLCTKVMDAYKEYIKLLGEYIKLKDISQSKFTEELIYTIKKNIFYQFTINGSDNGLYNASVENPAVSFNLLNYPIRVNSNAKVFHWGATDTSNLQPMKYLWITPPIFNYAVNIIGPLITLSNTTLIELLNVTGNSFISNSHMDLFDYCMQKNFNLPLAYRFTGGIINHNHVNTKINTNEERPIAGYNGITNRYINDYNICVGTHDWKNEFYKFVSVRENAKKSNSDGASGELIDPNVFTVRFLYDLIDWIQTCTRDDCYTHRYVAKELTLHQYAEKYLSPADAEGVMINSSLPEEVSDWSEKDSEFYKRMMGEIYCTIKELIELVKEIPEEDSDSQAIKNRIRPFWDHMMTDLLSDYFKNVGKTILHPGILTAMFLFYKLNDVWFATIGAREVCMNIISLMEQALMALLGEFIIMEEFSGRAKRFPLYNSGVYTNRGMIETLQVSPLLTFMDISRKTYITVPYSPQDIQNILDVYEYYMSYR